MDPPVYILVGLYGFKRMINMAKKTKNEPDVEKIRKRFEKHREKLGKIDFILTGSISKRFMRCGTKGCRCHTDPTALHGPYYEWTRKVKGKTVSVRLKEEEALVLMDWIKNKRKFYKTASEMEKLTFEAVNVIRS